MTRKDYINIAGAIQACQARIAIDFDRQQRAERSKDRIALLEDDKDQQLRGVRRAAAHLADFLKDDNPRFDQARFLKACGYGGMPESMLRRETGKERPAEFRIDN